MASNSRIEWTETTWNPVIGCSKVSEGCRHCYAMTMAKRLAAMSYADEGYGRDPGRKLYYRQVVRHKTEDLPGGLRRVPQAEWNGDVVTVDEALTEPLGWKRPRRVFVDSMGDLFHPSVPFGFIDRVFAVMALCPQHTFQVLTKRPERMATYLNYPQKSGVKPVAVRVLQRAAAMVDSRGRDARVQRIITDGWPLPNVWLGTSVEDQATADERIPYLLRCPAAVRFLSCEPLLGPVELRPHWLATGLGQCSGCLRGDPDRQRTHQGNTDQHPGPGIDWVIVGGESGPNARPMHPDWARSLRDQCQEAGVAFFFKQWGGLAPVVMDAGDGIAVADDRRAISPWGEDGAVMVRVGKKAAGRLLDGRTWDELPLTEGASR